MGNIDKIGNVAFEYEFPDANNGVKKVVVDPLFVMEYIKTMMPELGNLAPETRDSIRSTAASDELKERIPETDGDFFILDAIICRFITGQPYPVKYAPPLRSFYDNIRDALGATQMASIVDLWGAFYTCIRVIGELAGLKKNTLDSQDSPASTQASELTLQASQMKPSTVCGSTFPDSKQPNP